MIDLSKSLKDKNTLREAISGLIEEGLVLHVRGFSPFNTVGFNVEEVRDDYSIVTEDSNSRADKTQKYLHPHKAKIVYRISEPTAAS